MLNEKEHYDYPPVFRLPSVNDADEVYRLIKVCKPLDLNSRYTYLLLCDHFRDTCVIAHVKDRILAVVLGYIHPRKPNTLFVWQIAVDPNERKRRIALSMLQQLLNRDYLSTISYIEATAVPSNEASAVLFRSFGNRLEAPLKECVYFHADLFGEDNHEEEVLFRIGPIHK